MYWFLRQFRAVRVLASAFLLLKEENLRLKEAAKLVFEADMQLFKGGPLVDHREKDIHSLTVYMKGDGRYSIGSYVRQENGVLEWIPDNADNNV